MGTFFMSTFSRCVEGAMCLGELCKYGFDLSGIGGRFCSTLHPWNKQILADNPDIPAYQGVNQGWFEDLQLNGKLLNRVPKDARINCAKAYCKVLNQLVKNPEDRKSWRTLASFAQICLSNPNRGGRKNNSLATVVNKKIANFEKGIVEKMKTVGLNPPL